MTERPNPTTPKEAGKLRFTWTRDMSRAGGMPHGKAVKVSQIVDDYQKSHKYQSLGLGTKTAYQSAFKLIELLILSNNKNLYQMYVHKVDYGTVDYIHAVLAHTHKPASIKFYFAVLSNVWQVALRAGKAQINPWLRNEVRVDNERDITWSKEQLLSAVDGAKQHGFNLLALYLIMAYETGQRPWKDLRGLKWENIREFEGDTVVDYVISKTNVHMVLPLSPTAIEALERVSKIGEYIFVDARGRRLSPKTMHLQLDVVKKSCMLPQELTFRDIRRTVNVEMAENGATREEMRNVNGWQSDTHIPRYARLRYRTAKNGIQRRW